MKRLSVGATMRTSVIWLLLMTAWGAAADTLFTIEPAAATNVVGTSVAFRLSTEGSTPTDLISPQWFKEGVALSDDAQVSGAATPELRISDLRLTNAGLYTLTFTNLTAEEPVGVAISATLDVIDYPHFTSEITSVTRGSDVVFSVEAAGGMLAYQWLWQGQPIPGATNSALTFTNAYLTANAGYYNVRISNPANPDGLVSSAPALFVKGTPGGTYQGLYLHEEAVTPESTGFIQLQLSPDNRRFSGQLTSGAAKYPFTGQFAADHRAEVEVSRRFDTPLILKLQLLTLNDLPQIVGEVSSESWTSSVLANRLYYKAKLPTALAGNYTLALHNTNMSRAVPNGDPCAAAVIKRDGKIVLSGRAADGSVIQQAAGLSRAGDWPLFAVTHKGNGTIAGWLRVQSSSTNALTSPGVAWVKNPGPDALYPDGFGLTLQAIGSIYVPPTTNYAVQLTNAVASLYGGDLYEDDTATWAFINVRMNPPARFVEEKSPERLELRLSLSKGTIQGSFINSATRRRAKIYGVIFQQQRSGLGFFTSSAAAGAFNLSRANP